MNNEGKIKIISFSMAKKAGVDAEVLPKVKAKFLWLNGLAETGGFNPADVRKNATNS